MDLNPWYAYFAAQAGASATLAGLLFVALSINIGRILQMPWLPPRAAMTVVLLIGALLEALLAMWPRQTSVVFGSELFIVSCAVLLFVVRLSPAAATIPRDLVHYQFRNMTLMQIAAIPAVLGSVLIFLGQPVGVYALAFSLLMAVVVAFLNAWVLLVEILK